MSTIAPRQTRTLSANEFARRAGGGERIRLLWIPDVNQLLVEQLDIETKGVVLRAVPHGQGMIAFNHPEQYEPCRPDFDYEVTAGEIEIAAVS